MIPPKITSNQPHIKMENMTRQQLKKIEKSMKRPQFMGLLNQYMVEISDPKNKQQYDTYLRQMQKQGQLPKHMKLVQIKPQFCYRTRIVSSSNKRHQMKFFVNVCSSDMIQKPSFDLVPGQDGKMGQAWKIPNSMGKIRYDQDREGNVCQTVDAAFHPDVFKMVYNPAFQSMIINITLQSATKQLGERKQTLSKDYQVLKNRKCKGDAPALLPIRFIDGKLYNKGQGPEQEQQRNAQGKQTKLQKEINKQKSQFQKQKENDAKQNKRIEKQDKQSLQQQLQENQSKIITDLDKGPQRPKYSSIYTYPVDYTDYMMDGPSLPSVAANKKKNKLKLPKKLPTSFNIQFQVPKIQKISQLNITLNDNKIIIDGKDKYFIDLNLEQEFKIKYNLKKEQVKAKFDKKKKVLRIIYPVNQTQKEEELEQQQQQQMKDIDESLEETQKLQPFKQASKLVQAEVWKQKVLDFQTTQQKISLQIVDQSNKQQFQKKKQEQKKLIEQIDQDDYMQEKETQPVRERNEIKNFSVKQYVLNKKTQDSYKKRNQDSSTLLIKINPIQQVFQETTDKIVLIAKMANYSKQQIKVVLNTANIQNQIQIMLIRTLSKKESLNKEFQLFHKKLNNQDQKINKISYVQRVGFIAFMLQKSSKGNYYEKGCLQNLTSNYLNNENPQEKLKEFLERFDQIEKNNKQVELQKKNEKQEKQIVQKSEKNYEEKNLKAHTDKNNTSQKLNSLQIQKKTKQQQNTESKIQEMDENISYSNQNLTIFSQLQPQFIEFNAPFVDILN